jgi:hypothetical protein
MLDLTKKFMFHNSYTKSIRVRKRKSVSKTTSEKFCSKPRNACRGARYDILVQTS